MEEKIEMGTISARGQICIPTNMRESLNLEEGTKVLFVQLGDSLIIKKVNIKKTWEELTKPLRDAPKKIKEEDVVDLVHRIRKEKREKQ
jgi:AbrB family looped-hinge helix DNA binding protein